VWEPIPPPPGARGENAARVSVVAGGRGADLYFRGKTPANAPAPAGVQPAAPQRIVFEAPPGEMELELAIEDGSGEVLDRETQTITVADLSSGLVLTTPEVFRARTAREWQTLAADFDQLPLPIREFRRTDRLLVRVAARSDAGVPTVTARLLNRLGDAMTSPFEVAPSGRPGVTHIDAPLSSIPVGDYLIEIKAATGSEEKTSLLPFRVIG
jgi:hypothetical protein